MQQLRKDPYQEAAPDYDDLGRAVPDFAPYVERTSTGAPTINYQDDEAVRALTRALLQRDFDLDVQLPQDRLCPIVPGRLEYVLWMLQLAIDTRDRSLIQRPLVGLDIGTGASAIYPLLACRTLPDASFVATDVDPQSLECAGRNVRANGLKDSIRIIQAQPTGPLLPSEAWSNVDMQVEWIDLTMCNPPFYESHDEIRDLAALKAVEPFATCTGSQVEMITPGGEVAFVGRLVDESVSASSRIRWFSSLLGKHSSVACIVDKLRALHVSNYALYELTRGQTKRWIIAWSFQSARLPSAKYHVSTPSLTRFLPPSNSHTYHLPTGVSLSIAQEAVTQSLRSLEGVDVRWIALDVDRRVAEVRTGSNTWSRSARRAKGMGARAFDAPTAGGTETGTMGVNLDMGNQGRDAHANDSMLEATLVLICVRPDGTAISATDERSIDASGSHVKLEAEWTKGLDAHAKDWTALWGFVIRKLADSTKAAIAGQ